MTPDEIACATCEDEGAVVSWVPSRDVYPLWPLTPEAEDECRLNRHAITWGVDTCPECGRGREVGNL